MSSLLICASHSPLFLSERPRQHGEITAVFAGLAEAVAAFDPELVIQFGADHYTGMHMALMPAFCVGLAARAPEGDFGGFPGEFDVPAEQALELAGFLRGAEIDVAVSYDLVLDHGFTQAAQFLTGAVGRYPTIPVFVDAIAPPVPPLRRTRRLGAAVGRWLAGLDMRVLIIGSGGLSHEPALLFPPVDHAQDGVRDWILHGPGSSQMGLEAWFEHIEKLTRMGPPLYARGDLPDPTREAFDRRFLDLFTAGDLEKLDDWENDWIVEQGGNGAKEIHLWVAAGAAAQALGAPLPTLDYYAPVKEYAIAVGIAHAGPDA